MRHALALLAVAFLVTGCPKKTGENQTMDASTRDAGQTGTGSPEATPTAPTDAGAKTQGGDRAAVESCVDRWLQERKLDTYGHPEGTMYAGGSPLFNEATGESRDRLEYVFSRQPEARKACAASAQ
ncbi:hypothetical protein [Archangium sp.]|uniref:hypothetical protein n=1 Tax=Archangium sp. TaxID=1872627 RepID=UPI002D447CF4|nr:hypothetical protein [Archangium sp.]HYO52536.1 hypothetical protein [Archangium sp.]